MSFRESFDHAQQCLADFAVARRHSALDQFAHDLHDRLPFLGSGFPGSWNSLAHP